jgi:hypothetical protein
MDREGKIVDDGPIAEFAVEIGDFDDWLSVRHGENDE